MKTKEVIKLMMENDPSGEMEVILGADTGEGYVMLDKVFTDKVAKAIESFGNTKSEPIGLRTGRVWVR